MATRHATCAFFSFVPGVTHCLVTSRLFSLPAVLLHVAQSKRQLPVTAFDEHGQWRRFVSTARHSYNWRGARRRQAREPTLGAAGVQRLWSSPVWWERGSATGGGVPVSSVPFSSHLREIQIFLVCFVHISWLEDLPTFNGWWKGANSEKSFQMCRKYFNVHRLLNR